MLFRIDHQSSRATSFRVKKFLFSTSQCNRSNIFRLSSSFQLIIKKPLRLYMACMSHYLWFILHSYTALLKIALRNSFFTWTNRRIPRSEGKQREFTWSMVTAPNNRLLFLHCHLKAKWGIQVSFSWNYMS